MTNERLTQPGQAEERPWSVRIGFTLLGIFIFLGLSACSEGPAMLAACDEDDANSICGLQNPEDMVLLPGHAWAVVSEMMSDTEAEGLRFGRLQWLDVGSDVVTPFLQDGLEVALDNSLPSLGDAACSTPPDPARFGGHGVDARRLADGSTLLAAINHGEREAIELFSIGVSGETPMATWRGCVMLPRERSHNDVAIAANGDLYVSVFSANPAVFSFDLLSDFVSLFTGGNTGMVYHWSASKGISPVEGSEGSAPNGVALAFDDTALLFAEWGQKKVVRLDLSGQEKERREVQLPMAPDNFAWRSDGTLIVAAQEGDAFSILGCFDTPPTTCDIPYGVYAIDPNSMMMKELLTGVGAISVAMPVGDRIYVGSFAGDSIGIR